MALRVLDRQRAEALEALCEQIVPGSGRVGPVVYVDAVLATMPPEARAAALAAIDALAGTGTTGVLAGRHRTPEFALVGRQRAPEFALVGRQRTPEFALVRALAIEAYYSDFIAPGKPGPGAWTEIDFQPPRAADLERDWSWLGIS